jgi:hypothetical protein
VHGILVVALVLDVFGYLILFSDSIWEYAADDAPSLPPPRPTEEQWDDFLSISRMMDDGCPNTEPPLAAP